MLVLFALIAIFFVFSALLFGIVMIVVGFLGGASVAVRVNNKIFRNLLFIGFSILLIIGILCLIPIITVYANLSLPFLIVANIAMFICIAILSIAGIIFSRSIQNKIGNLILIVIFSIILIAALSLAISIIVTSVILK